MRGAGAAAERSCIAWKGPRGAGTGTRGAEGERARRGAGGRRWYRADGVLCCDGALGVGREWKEIDRELEVYCYAALAFELKREEENQADGGAHDEDGWHWLRR